MKAREKTVASTIQKHTDNNNDTKDVSHCRFSYLPYSQRMVQLIQLMQRRYFETNERVSKSDWNFKLLANLIKKHTNIFVVEHLVEIRVDPSL